MRVGGNPFIVRHWFVVLCEDLWLFGLSTQSAHIKILSRCQQAGSKAAVNLEHYCKQLMAAQLGYQAVTKWFLKKIKHIYG